jgi:hypothetical protein
MEKSRIRDGKKSDPGSGINIPDPKHWIFGRDFTATGTYWITDTYTRLSSSNEKYLSIPWGPVLQREEGVLRGGGGGGELRLQAGDLVEEGGGAQSAAKAPQLCQLPRPHHQLARVHEVHQAGHHLNTEDRTQSAADFSAVFRIRTGSGFNQVSGSVSGSRRAKKTHKNTKIMKFHVLKCWMFSFEGLMLLL